MEHLEVLIICVIGCAMVALVALIEYWENR